MRGLYQAIVQRQAHLQFTRKLPTEQKIAKELAFFHSHKDIFQQFDRF